MAKGKGKAPYGSRKASAMDLSALGDNVSETSERSHDTRGEDVAAVEELLSDDIYEHSLDLLLEKRGATRVRALEALIAYMKADVRADEADKNCFTLVRLCTSSLRKGSTTERELAATAMGLHILSLPEATESLLLEMQPELDRAAREGPAEVRSAAIESLAMACYVAAEDEALTLGVMERMQELWTKGEAAAPRAASLRGWALLFTSLTGVLRAAEVEAALQEMAELMADKSVDVRTAAGGVVAVLCSSYRFLQQGSEGPSDGGFDDDDLASQASSSEAANLDGLVHRMRDLATHNRHDTLRTSKRDKAALRTTFRAILDSVEEGAVKAERIKLRHCDVLTVDTLAGKVALDAVKRVLGGGLHAHLQANPLLHAIFGFRPASEAPARLSRLEKRAFRSPSSAAAKGKTAGRKHDREFKSSRHAAGLPSHVDEDA